MNEELDIGALLVTLTNDQLNHLSIGLEHAFGVVLAGNHGEPDFNLVLESGLLIGLDADTLTVQDAWNAAEAATK